MHALGRRVIAAAGTAAACLLMAAGAFAENRPASVPRSTLVSNSSLRFDLAYGQKGDTQVMALVHSPAAGKPLPVAEVSTSADGVVSFSLRPGSANSAVKIGTIERLYVLALRQDAEARFSFQGKQLSHGELLAELVKARARAAQGLRPASVPWRVVSIAAAPSGNDEDDVAAIVKGDQGPMKGVTLYFNRAPHSSCSATTREDGVARCHLVDQHGDEEAHDDKAAVVATFPGDVRADRVLVPITAIVRAPSAGPAQRPDRLAKEVRGD
jgi:hypothetical protein